MILVAWTFNAAACRAAAGRLGLPPVDEVREPAEPGRWWWLTPPADLLDLLAELAPGDAVIASHHPACSSPLVVAAAEAAAAAGGVSLHAHPKLPKWLIGPVRLAVDVAKPADWEPYARELRRKGASFTRITRELEGLRRRGVLREAPSRSAIVRRLRDL